MADLGKWKSTKLGIYVASSLSRNWAHIAKHIDWDTEDRNQNQSQRRYLKPPSRLARPQ